MQGLEEAAKHKGRAERLPNVAIDNVEKGTATALMNTLSIIAPSENKKRIQDMSNQELRAEIDAIVNKCIQNDVRIGIEVLCLGLKTNKQTLWNYEHGIGCDEERKQIICEIKQFLRAYIEQLTLGNKISAPVGIFWAKNYCSMSDVQVVENRQSEQEKALSLDELPRLEELFTGEESKKEQKEKGFISNIDWSDKDMSYM